MFHVVKHTAIMFFTATTDWTWPCEITVRLEALMVVTVEITIIYFCAVLFGR